MYYYAIILLYALIQHTLIRVRFPRTFRRSLGLRRPETGGFRRFGLQPCEGIGYSQGHFTGSGVGAGAGFKGYTGYRVESIGCCVWGASDMAYI